MAEIKRLSEDDIKKIIGNKKKHYQDNVAYYESKNPELYSTWQDRRARQISPNNYAPSGYARYIVDILTGYIASPGYVEYSSDNEDYLNVINDINKANKEPTVTNQEVRESGIQGKDFELHFLEKDDDGQLMPRFLSVPGFECYPIYSDDLDPKLEAFVRVIKKNEEKYDIWVYYKDVIQRSTMIKNSLVKSEEEQINEYNEIPWNIGRNNICFEPDFKQVITYINIIDAIQTNTLNALDKNGRAVILTSLPKSEEIAKDLKNLNIVFGMEKGDDGEGKDFFDYASMELNTDLREHMLDHFINELHKISGIFDFTKLDLGQDPSGTALQYRIYPMELKASEKVAYRLEFLRHRYELITQIINKYTISGSTRISNADVDELEITMKRNIPANIKAILEENMLMSGYVDKTTLIERVQGLDAQKIQKRKEEEIGDMDLITDPDASEALGEDGLPVPVAENLVALNGAQITAARGIAEAVTAGDLPRAEGVALVVAMGVPREQAESMIPKTVKLIKGATDKTKKTEV